MAAKHAEVVRLTLHVIPAGETELHVVASTLRSRLGTLSDPEDVVAFKGGLEVVLAEGDNTDVTLPIKNSAGKVVARDGHHGQGRPRAGHRARAQPRRRARAQPLEDQPAAVVSGQVRSDVSRRRSARWQARLSSCWSIGLVA
jgi:hypothetical protein